MNPQVLKPSTWDRLGKGQRGTVGLEPSFGKARRHLQGVLRVLGLFWEDGDDKAKEREGPHTLNPEVSLDLIIWDRHLLDCVFLGLRVSGFNALNPQP